MSKGTAVKVKLLNGTFAGTFVRTLGDGTAQVKPAKHRGTWVVELVHIKRA